MARRRRRLSRQQQQEVWTRWCGQETLADIARALQMSPTGVWGTIRRHGGIRPAVRTRAPNALTLTEREVIERGRAAGMSMQSLGHTLGRPASTISRELLRNGRPTKQWSGRYDGERAHVLALRRRRWDARFKLARQPDLRDRVRNDLAMGRSPEQIAGRLALEQGRTLISHESIYRFIYHRSAQKDYWHRLLPRAKSRRGRLGRRGGSPASRKWRPRCAA